MRFDFILIPDHCLSTYFRYYGQKVSGVNDTIRQFGQTRCIFKMPSGCMGKREAVLLKYTARSIGEQAVF